MDLKGITDPGCPIEIELQLSKPFNYSEIF